MAASLVVEGSDGGGTPLFKTCLTASATAREIVSAGSGPKNCFVPSGRELERKRRALGDLPPAVELNAKSVRELAEEFRGIPTPTDSMRDSAEAFRTKEEAERGLFCTVLLNSKGWLSRSFSKRLESPT